MLSPLKHSMVLHTCIRCTVAARTWMAYLPKYRWKDLKQWMLHICRGHHVAFRDPCREHWRRWPSAMGGPNIFKKYLEIWTARNLSKYMYVYIHIFVFDTTSTNLKVSPCFCKTTLLSKILGPRNLESFSGMCVRRVILKQRACNMPCVWLALKWVPGLHGEVFCQVAVLVLGMYFAGICCIFQKLIFVKISI